MVSPARNRISAGVRVSSPVVGVRISFACIFFPFFLNFKILLRVRCFKKINTFISLCGQILLYLICDVKKTI